MSENLKRLLVFLALFVALFTLTLALQNGTRLIVTIKAEDGKPLYPRLYWAPPGAPFAESRSVAGIETGEGRFRFNLPVTPGNVERLRLDPSVRADRTIQIGRPYFERQKWLKTVRYVPEGNPFANGDQLIVLSRSTNGVKVKTTGRDPKLALRPRPYHKETTIRLPLFEALVSLAGALLLSYLWILYRTRKDEEGLSIRLVLYALFLFFAIFKAVYYKDHVRYGHPPDETAHVAYVEYIAEHPSFLPDFSAMPHYLSHPPLYYELAAAVKSKEASRHENVMRYRQLSVLLYTLAIMLLLYFGFNLNVGPVAHLAYLAAITSVPMYAYIGASVSNDNLAMLGGALFALALLRLIRAQSDSTTALLLGTALFIAFFAKLTAALLAGFALLAFLIHAALNGNVPKPGRKEWLLLALFVAPILFYQLGIFVRYHAVVPTYNVTHPEAFLRSGFYTPEPYRLHLTPVEWFWRMVHYIRGGWFGIHSHHSFGHPQVWGFAGLLALHLFALLGWLLPCDEKNRALCLLGKYTLFAIAAVLVVQYLFSYKAHLKNGYLGGLQPRYLLPFMFSFAILSSVFVERLRRYYWWNVAIVAVAVHAIYSDFFYFLLYYR